MAFFPFLNDLLYPREGHRASWAYIGIRSNRERVMKARFVMVMVLALGVLGASSPAFADCLNATADCAWGGTGWQGTCYRGLFKGCQRCGPVHCANTIGYGAEQMPKQVRGACVDKILAYGRGNGRIYHGCFNIHLYDPVSRKLSGLLTGACDERNICYHIPGKSKEACDAMFAINMLASCSNYYNSFPYGNAANYATNSAMRSANEGMGTLCADAAPVWALRVNSNIYNQDQALGKQICK